MKKRVYFLSVAVTVIFHFASCKDVYGDNYNKSPAAKSVAAANKSENNIITFTVNGEPVKTSGWNIARFTMGDKVQLNITSNMHIDKRTINVNLNSDKAGKYILKNDGSMSGFSYGSYAPDYEDLLNRFTFYEGEFDITQVDTVKGIVNGTFRGKASNTQEKSFEITDGKIINGELKPGIQKF